MKPINKGNTVGSRFDNKVGIDPVTTDLVDAQASASEIEGSTACFNRSKFMATIIRRPQICTAALFCSYISGYVDGEGCFTVSISKRPKMTTGWEIRPSFSVSQNQDRAQVLYMMAEYFDCGTIRPDRSDKTLKYEVRSLSKLLERIIPHFGEYPLMSEKQRSFEAFRSICLEMAADNHLSSKHVQSILERAEEINKGKRKYKFGKI